MIGEKSIKHMCMQKFVSQMAKVCLAQNLVILANVKQRSTRPDGLPLCISHDGCLQTPVQRHVINNSKLTVFAKFHQLYSKTKSIQVISILQFVAGFIRLFSWSKESVVDFV